MCRGGYSKPISNPIGREAMASHVLMAIVTDSLLTVNKTTLFKSYILGTSRNEMETIDIELEMPLVWHSRGLETTECRG